MLGRLLVVGVIVALCGLFVIFQTTSPSLIGPLGILAVFVFLYIFLVCTITPVILFFWKVRQRFTRRNTSLIKSSVQRAYYFASVIALAPIILLAIGSVGSVGLYDVILIALFVIVACVYVAKRTR